MAADNHRTTTAQNRARRYSDVRRLNNVEQVIDTAPDATSRTGAVVVHEQFSAEADADTTAEASATFGDPLKTEGYDHIELLLRCQVVGGLTSISVIAQASYDAGEWYDLFEDEAGDGALVRKLYVWSSPGADNTGVAFRFPVVGKFMRFKTFTAGTRTDTRVVLYARRTMASQ